MNNREDITLEELDSELPNPNFWITVTVLATILYLGFGVYIGEVSLTEKCSTIYGLGLGFVILSGAVRSILTSIQSTNAIYAWQDRQIELVKERASQPPTG